MELFCDECGDMLSPIDVQLKQDICVTCRGDEDDYIQFKTSCQVPGCINEADYKDTVPICDECDAHIRAGRCPSCYDNNPDATEKIICRSCSSLLYLDSACPDCFTPRSMQKSDTRCLKCTLEKSQ